MLFVYRIFLLYQLLSVHQNQQPLISETYIFLSVTDTHYTHAAKQEIRSKTRLLHYCISFPLGTVSTSPLQSQLFWVAHQTDSSLQAEPDIARDTSLSKLNSWVGLFYRKSKICAVSVTLGAAEADEGLIQTDKSHKPQQHIVLVNSDRIPRALWTLNSASPP